MQGETSVIDLAYQAMDAAPEDETARMRFHALVADTALFLLVDSVDGATLSPQIFDLEAGRFVMAFDREERLAAFTGAPAEHALLPGRVIVAGLQGQGIGVGLNLGVAPSSFLMGPEAVDWLAATLGTMPEETIAGIAEVTAPDGLPEALIGALEGRLAQMAGMARQAVLAGVLYRDGRRGHGLAIIGAAQPAEVALAKAVAEALAFSGVDAGELDVLFAEGDAPVTAAFRARGLVLDLPEPQTGADEAAAKAIAEGRAIGAAPGMDPSRPPRLK